MEPGGGREEEGIDDRAQLWREATRWDTCEEGMDKVRAHVPVKGAFTSQLPKSSQLKHLS